MVPSSAPGMLSPGALSAMFSVMFSMRVSIPAARARMARTDPCPAKPAISLLTNYPTFCQQFRAMQSGLHLFRRDAVQKRGRHDKNDPLFSGFSSLQSSEIIVFPGRIKVSHGKPTEKWVVFIRAGKLCRSSALGGGIVEKGGGGAFCQQFRHPACRLTLLQRVRRANETLY